MSRFPRLTETFVLYEILAAQALGIHVDVYPLLREGARVVHPEAHALMDNVTFTRFFSRQVLTGQLYWLRRAPGRYLGALWAVARGTWGSANFFFGGISIFPKVAHMARLMEADGVEHVHCHFANHPALAGLIIRRLTGITYSFTGHGSDIYVDRHMLCQKIEEAAFMIVVSEYGREVVLAECGEGAREKVHLVHCGVDTSLFTPGSEAGSQELTIACIGRLAPWKGQRHLVDACKLLADRAVPFRCAIAGGAGDRDSLEARMSELGLGSRVSIVGWKTRPEVARLIDASDVVVAPSVPADGKLEGIPVTLMEAMACGKPVVASRVGGIPELVEHDRTGLLVPPGDPAALADALERLHSSPDLRRTLGRAGREKVLQDFDLRTNAAEVVRRIRAVATTGC